MKFSRHTSASSRAHQCAAAHSLGSAALILSNNLLAVIVLLSRLQSRGGNGSVVDRTGPEYHCFFSDQDLIIRFQTFKNIFVIPIFQTQSVYFSETFGFVTNLVDQRALGLPTVPECPGQSRN